VILLIDASGDIGSARKTNYRTTNLKRQQGPLKNLQCKINDHVRFDSQT